MLLSKEAQSIILQATIMESQNLNMQHNGLGNKQQSGLFNTVFLPLSDAVMNYSMQLCGRDVMEAEDLWQETFFKAWQKQHLFQVDTNAKAWMFTICRNTFINLYRKRKTRPQTTELEDGRLLADDEGQVKTIGGVEFFNSDLNSYGDEVQAALDSLKPIHRHIIILDLEGFTYEEMAEILNIKLGTVRSRLHRARNILAETLKSYARTMGYGGSDSSDVVNDY